MLIDLNASDGSIGSALLFTYTPAALEATRQMVLSLGESLKGQLLAPFDLDRLLAQRLRLIGHDVSEQLEFVPST